MQKQNTYLFEEQGGKNQEAESTNWQESAMFNLWKTILFFCTSPRTPLLIQR